MRLVFTLLLLSGVVGLSLPEDSSLPFVNQQPEAPIAPPSRHRSLDWGSINFIHTTDVHVSPHLYTVVLILRVG
jgi:hypothetical protein